jgi:hypothetical protein
MFKVVRKKDNVVNNSIQRKYILHTLILYYKYSFLDGLYYKYSSSHPG